MDKYNTYVVNICVDTKSTDIYDKVAINKFPIILSCKESQLRVVLGNDDFKNYIHQHISKQLFDNAQFYIRIIDDNGIYGDEESLKINIKDIIEYNKE